MTSKEKIRKEVKFLFGKILIFLFILWVMFFQIFGIMRCADSMMKPAFQNGDLVIYDRMQRSYDIEETSVIKKDEKLQVMRIVASEGDTIDMTKDGIKINGYLQRQNEMDIKTFPYKEGITFPITVQKDEFFVLGDNREHSIDSRIYGTVKKAEIKGSVITLLRRRGF